MADSDFVPVPTKGLVSPDYLAKRRGLLEGDTALLEVTPGTPSFDHARLIWANDESLELPSTSHISIVDSYGNALSMTTTIENAFGSRLMVRGFLLNNELTDFSFRTHSGGVPIANALALGQILGMLEGFDLAALGPDNPESWRLIGDASRLAFADRGRFMADSDHVPMPTRGLVDPAYLAERGRLLSGDDALPEVAPGNPPFDHAALWADDASLELPSTTHLSIVDGDGNVLSMTSTIENAFGSRLMVRGFLLNNELTDFSFQTHENGVPIANRLAPGKRPRSSMAPTIVLRDGAPVLAIGSPGGSRIIGYVAKSIIAWADWGLDVQQALALPHAVNRFGTFDLEAGTGAEALAAPLTALGFEVSLRDLNSGLHAIEIGPDGLQGGADPRREGIAFGR
jgi:gamma-glutamyltranspeptidase/glutathione hydrolase